MPVARQQAASFDLPLPQELNPDVRLRVSPLVISEIINNFCDNAIKYRAVGTPIRVRFRWSKGATAYLEFRNLAPRLTNDEIGKLGTTVFRSAYAVSRSSDGQGLGLIANRRLAERWKMKLIHREEPTEREVSVNVWHVFGLKIPGKLIFEDVMQRPIERIRRP
jgi:signal transduction histidine kinase